MQTPGDLSAPGVRLATLAICRIWPDGSRRLSFDAGFKLTVFGVDQFGKNTEGGFEWATNFLATSTLDSLMSSSVKSV